MVLITLVLLFSDDFEVLTTKFPGIQTDLIIQVTKTNPDSRRRARRAAGLDSSSRPALYEMKLDIFGLFHQSPLE